jgi:hypothetical protein
MTTSRRLVALERSELPRIAARVSRGARQTNSWTRRDPAWSLEIPNWISAATGGAMNRSPGL